MLPGLPEVYELSPDYYEFCKDALCTNAHGRVYCELNTRQCQYTMSYGQGTVAIVL